MCFYTRSFCRSPQYAGRRMSVHQMIRFGILRNRTAKIFTASQRKPSTIFLPLCTLCFKMLRTLSFLNGLQNAVDGPIRELIFKKPVFSLDHRPPSELRRNVFKPFWNLVYTQIRRSGILRVAIKKKHCFASIRHSYEVGCSINLGNISNSPSTWCAGKYKASVSKCRNFPLPLRLCKCSE